MGINGLEGVVGDECGLCLAAVSALFGSMLQALVDNR